MKNKGKPTKPGQVTDENNKAKTPGYPLYPDKEDIYRKAKEEKGINPDDINITKGSIPRDKFQDDLQEDIDDDAIGDDLDVPGSELDDEQEDIGNEDEENNYYSIGGDRHNDLEEDPEEDLPLDLDDEDEDE